MIMGCLSGCFVETTFRSPFYSRLYRLKENAMAFDCYGTVPLTWGADPQCLFELGLETARPPQFPTGTPVRVLTIKRDVIAQSEVAFLRVGAGSKAVAVFARWPQVLRILEEVTGNEGRQGGLDRAGNQRPPHSRSGLDARENAFSDFEAR
jgi:hypothetical protein